VPAHNARGGRGGLAAAASHPVRSAPVRPPPRGRAALMVGRAARPPRGAELAAAVRGERSLDAPVQQAAWAALEVETTRVGAQTASPAAAWPLHVYSGGRWVEGERRLPCQLLAASC